MIARALKEATRIFNEIQGEDLYGIVVWSDQRNDLIVQMGRPSLIDKPMRVNGAVVLTPCDLVQSRHDHAVGQLRHLYKQLIHAGAASLADGLLAPAIEVLER